MLEQVVNRAKNFRYHSFQQLVPSEPIKVFEGDEYILVAERERDRIKLFWAVNAIESLPEVLEQSAKDLAAGELIVEFIPPEFINSLEKAGLRVSSEWIDFWLKDLPVKRWDYPLTAEIRLIKAAETGLAAAVTRSCAGMSRQFFGEGEAGIIEWLNQQEQQVFVAIKNGEIVGTCMIGTYQGKLGKVVWLRLLAVHPDQQGQGIGRSLAKVGLEWGQQQGCTVSFLATDTENFPAIHLYEKLGYQRQEGRGQINMVYKIKKKQS